MKARTWDVFCRVVDNFGDIGVCWRLSADLARRGERVRLWVDDPSALAWMAPEGAPGVDVMGWRESEVAADPGDVVVEAFGCDPPSGFVARMAARAIRPCWIDLEYLSAEPYVERSHGLRSPQSSGPGAGLVKRFFYPGFGPGTGGLLREADLAPRQGRFDAAAWLRSAGVERGPGERVASLFCYERHDEHRGLSRMLAALAEQPTCLLATAGAAARQVEALLGPGGRMGGLRAVTLPFLGQVDYDHLLWASDLNFVRGEDSFVRAQWAGVPFVWQIYPQSDGVHLRKLDAFLDRFFLAGAEPSLAAGVRAVWSAWNGEAAAAPRLPDLRAWGAHCAAWRERLSGRPDLTTLLIAFAFG